MTSRDGNIRYYEYESDSLFGLDEHKSSDPQRGMCFLPRRALSVSDCEIARAYKLCGSSVEPIAFICPRKARLVTILPEDNLLIRLLFRPTHSNQTYSLQHQLSNRPYPLLNSSTERQLLGKLSVLMTARSHSLAQPLRPRLQHRHQSPSRTQHPRPNHLQLPPQLPFPGRNLNLLRQLIYLNPRRRLPLNPSPSRAPSPNLIPHRSHSPNPTLMQASKKKTLASIPSSVRRGRRSETSSCKSKASERMRGKLPRRCWMVNTANRR